MSDLDNESNDIIKKLPGIFQTEVNKKFFKATFDQTFSKDDLDKLYGFIGRRDTKVFDNENEYYIRDSSRDKFNYQLEPSLVIRDANENIVDSISYLKFLSYIESFGGSIKNHNRLFSDTYYSFSPPIDIEKIIKYQNFYWSNELYTLSQYIEDKIKETGVISWYLPIEIEKVYDGDIKTNIIGQKLFIYHDPDEILIESFTEKNILAGKTNDKDVYFKYYLIENENNIVEGSYDLYNNGNILLVKDRPHDPIFDYEFISEQEYYEAVPHDIEDDPSEGPFTTLFIKFQVPPETTDEIKLTYEKRVEFEVIFMNGLRVTFPDSTSYKNTYTVEGVGDKIILVEDRSQTLPTSIDNEVNWGWSSSDASASTYKWGNFPWDSYSIIDEDPSYITIERGSLNRNDWSKINKWFHLDVITYSSSILVQKLNKKYGMDLSVDILSNMTRSERPIIEYKRDLKLFDYPEVILHDVTLASEVKFKSIYNEKFLLDYQSSTYPEEYDKYATPKIDGVELKSKNTLIFLDEEGTIDDLQLLPKYTFGPLPERAPYVFEMEVDISDLSIFTFIVERDGIEYVRNHWFAIDDLVDKIVGITESEVVTEGLRPGDLVHVYIDSLLIIDGSLLSNNESKSEFFIDVDNESEIIKVDILDSNGDVEILDNGEDYIFYDELNKITLHSIDENGVHVPRELQTDEILRIEKNSFINRTLFISEYIWTSTYIPSEYDQWQADTSYNIGDIILPDTNDTDFLYILKSIEYIDTWQANYDYKIDDIVKPSAYSNKIYICLNDHTSGSSEPTWSDSLLDWSEYVLDSTNTTGSVAPTEWATNNNEIVLDSGMIWVSDSYDEHKKLYQLYLLPYQNVKDRVEKNQGVYVLDGIKYSGNVFTFNGSKWILNQTNQLLSHNQYPLFDLFYSDLEDGEAKSLSEFDNSTFEGSKIFSYKEDTTGLQEKDNVLGISLVFTGLGEIFDIVMVNNLVADDYYYTPDVTEDSLERIPGYYYYAITSKDGVSEYETSWKSVEGRYSKQYVVDFFVIRDENTRVLIPSVKPSLKEDELHHDIKIEYQGNVLVEFVDFVIDDEYNEVVFQDHIQFKVNENVLLEVYSNEDDLSSNRIGYYHIPQQLEKNALNEEIEEASINNLYFHFLSIYDNQNNTFIEEDGSVKYVSYQNTEKDISLGEYIVQNDSSLLKSMLVISNDELDLLKAIDLAGSEYQRYKNELLYKIELKIKTEPFSYNWLDDILGEISSTRLLKDSFKYSNMISFGDINISKTYQINNEGYILLEDYYDLSQHDNFVSIFYNDEGGNSGKVALEGFDYHLSEEDGVIRVDITNSEILYQGFVLVKLYNSDSTKSYLPPTPSKLGIYSVHKPRIEVDYTYITPTKVLIGHDGSRSRLYNDERDLILLEFEKRIYNNINQKYKDEYLPLLSDYDIRPGYFRNQDNTRYSKDEYDQALQRQFYKWELKNKLNHRINYSYDFNNWKTYNYRTENNSIGNWRGIYKYYYDTEYPDTNPWEMLGFSIKPEWWDREYATNIIKMWDDIESGYIRDGSRKGVDKRFIREGLRDYYMPIDENGNLKSVLDIIDNNQQFIFDQKWLFGDDSPVEIHWKNSSEYPYHLLRALFILKPGIFGEKLWETSKTSLAEINNSQIIFDNTKMRRKYSDSYVHGEIVDNDVIYREGYQQFISDRLLSMNKNLITEFGDKIRKLDVQLSYEISGFIKKKSLKLEVEGVSDQSIKSDSLFIPSEDITVLTDTTKNVERSIYSGVLIRHIGNHKYTIFGYSLLEQHFTVNKRDNPLRLINVGGEFVDFEKFRIDREYEKGVYVKHNTIFYLCLVDHFADKFYDKYWKNVSELPTKGGVSVYMRTKKTSKQEYIDYDHQFNSQEEIFNFLVEYGDYLESIGFIFDQVDPTTGEILNWIKSAKDFLYWSITATKDGDVLLLNPSAKEISYLSSRGYSDNFYDIYDGTSNLLNQHGMVIDKSLLGFRRGDQKVTVYSSNPDISSLYYLQVRTKEVQHKILINNVTEFDNVLYSPLYSSRKTRLLIQGERSKDWYGKKEAKGHLIIDDDIVSNFDNLVDEFIKFYDHNNYTSSPFIELDRYLIGFESGYPKEDDVINLANPFNVTDNIKYKFYQGLIQEKGTMKSITKSLRYDDFGKNADIEIFEEWMFKVGQYGNVHNDLRQEFLINDNDVKMKRHTLSLDYPTSTYGKVKEIILAHNRETYFDIPEVVIDPPNAELPFSIPATAVVVLNELTNRIDRIEITDPGYGYTDEPNVSIYKTSFLEQGYLSNDRAYTILERDISETDNIKLINYDVDDVERWIGKPYNYQKNQYFPLTDDITYLMPNAGYVHKDDVDFMTYDTHTLFDLWGDDKDTKPNLNQYIWIADLSEFEWNWGVFRIADSTAKVYYITRTEEALEYEMDEEGEYIIDDNGYKIPIEDQIRPVSLIYTNKLLTENINRYSAFNLSTQITQDYSINMILGKVILGDSIYNVKFRPKFEGEFELTHEGVQSDERDGYFIYEITNPDGSILSQEEVDLLNFKLNLPCYLYEDGDNKDKVLDLNDFRNSNNEAYILRSVRYSNVEGMKSDNFEVNVWIDKNEDNKWAVYLNRSPEFVDIVSRIQEDLIDSKLLKNSFLYDNQTKETRLMIPFYDPFKNILPGEASRNITFVKSDDPSKYLSEEFRNRYIFGENIESDDEQIEFLLEDLVYFNNLVLSNADLSSRSRFSSGVFGPLEVGMTWLDTSKFKYLYYEQGDVLYRNDNWGKLFPGSELKVYEWVESTVPPAEFTGDGIPRNNDDYNIREYYDSTHEENRIKYYFWVSDKKSVPEKNNLQYRTTSIINVENLLKDPDGYGFIWSAVSSPYSIIVSNFSNLIRSNDMVYQVNYSLLDNNSKSHKEWILLRENDINSIIPDYFITKMVDSLVGYNSLWQVVPDQRLSENEKYGTLLRPRQSWFKNLLEARRTFVYVLNMELANINMNKEGAEWRDDITTDSYWYIDTWYAEGYDKFNTTSDIQLDAITDINGKEDEYNGKIIKVESLDYRSLYLVEDSSVRLISESNGRLIIRDETYQHENNLDLNQELREIIESLFNHVFTDDKADVINRIFFAMIHYVLSEQGDVDWINKSSYIYIINKRSITSEKNFNLQYDITDRIIEYINGIKPYHTKIRELKSEYLIDEDNAEILSKEIVNDKNITVKFDRIQSDLSVEDLRLIKTLGYDDTTFYDDIERNVLITHNYGSAGRYVFHDSQIDTIANIQFVDTTDVRFYYETSSGQYYLRKSAFTTDTDINGNTLALRDDEDNIIGLGLPTEDEVKAYDDFNEDLRRELDCEFKGQIVNPLEFGETKELGWGKFNWNSGFWTPDDTSESFITPTDGDMKFDDEVEPVYRNKIPTDRTLTELERNTCIYRPFEDVIGDPLDETDEYYVEVNGKYESNVRISDQGYLMFLISIDKDGNINYGPKPNDLVEVYDVFPLDGDGFLQPHVREGLAEEMISIDPGESLVINVDNSISDHTILYPGDDPTWDVGWKTDDEILNVYYPEVAEGENPEDVVTPSPYHKNDFTITTINNWDERLWDRSQEQDDQDQTVYYKSKYLLPLQRQSIKSLKVFLYTPDIDDLGNPSGTNVEMTEGVDYVIETVDDFFDVQEFTAQYDDLYETILDEMSQAWGKGAWDSDTWDSQYMYDIIKQSSLIRFIGGSHHDYYQSVKIDLTLYPVSFKYHYDHAGSVTYYRNADTNYNGSVNYSTRLARPLLRTDTKIWVDDTSVLTVPTETSLGIIWIRGEKVGYSFIDNSENSISELIRGMDGTTMSNHSVDEKVFDGSIENHIPNPESGAWVNSIVFEYSGSSTEQGLFLQNRPGQFKD